MAEAASASAFLETLQSTPFEGNDLSGGGTWDNIVSDYDEGRGAPVETEAELLPLHRNSIEIRKQSSPSHSFQESTEEEDEEDEEWAAYEGEAEGPELAMLLPGASSSPAAPAPVAKAGSIFGWRPHALGSPVAAFSSSHGAKETNGALGSSSSFFSGMRGSKAASRCNLCLFDDGIPVAGVLSLTSTAPIPRGSSVSTVRESEYTGGGGDVDDGAPTCAVSAALRMAASGGAVAKRVRAPEGSAEAESQLAKGTDDDDAQQQSQPSRQSQQPPTTELRVHAADGGYVVVAARKDDVALSVLSAAALRLGIAADAISNLSLYAVDDLSAKEALIRPESRISPRTPVSALEWTVLKTPRKLLMAVRLYSPDILRAARRGFHPRAANSDSAMAKLVYAQSVASCMACQPALPRLLDPPPRSPRAKCAQGDDDDDDDPYLAFVQARPRGTFEVAARSPPKIREASVRAAFSREPDSTRPSDPRLSCYDVGSPRGSTLSLSSDDTATMTTTTPKRGAFSSSTPTKKKIKKTAASLPTEAASALRLGALRLWTRAGDLVEDSGQLGIISAAVQLVRDHGACHFVPPVRPEAAATLPDDVDWDAELLEELDWLLKIQVKTARQLGALSTATSVSESEGITIEVFDEAAVKPTTTPLHTIQVERGVGGAAAAPTSSSSAAGAAFSLLAAACYFRLVSTAPLFGAALFACRAKRKAASEDRHKGFAAAFSSRLVDDASAPFNRVLAVSRTGVRICDHRLEPVQAVDFKELRRWICSGHDVRFESEECLEHESLSSAGRGAPTSHAAERIQSATKRAYVQNAKSVHVKANERFANRTRAKLRKSIRVAASLPPPRTPRQRTVDASREHPKSAEDAGIVGWARSLFATSPTPSIGEKIHEALAEKPHDEGGDDDDDETARHGAGLVDKDDASLLMKRVVFELKLAPDLVSGQSSKRSDLDTDRRAAEIVGLLDEYVQLDLAETRPRCRYESVFAPRRNGEALNEQGMPTARPDAAAPPAVEKGASTETPTSEVEATRPRVPDSDEAQAILGGRPSVYKALVSAVVRPPRFVYETRLLGPSSFDFAGRRIFRHDLILRNKDGKRIHCSHWKPVGPACGDDVKHGALNFNSPESGFQETAASSSDEPEMRRSKSSSSTTTTAGSTPCVVFMHANSASRVQACTYLSVVLSLGYSMFAFDCCGSGVSDGDFVTLGWQEAYDLLVVVAHLRSLPDVGHVAVWGHSMGAAAVIYYQAFSKGKWPRLDACVLDSPYSDFKILAHHLVSNNAVLAGTRFTQYLASFSVFSAALQVVIDSIDSSVQYLVGVSPQTDLSPVSNAHHCAAPALFLQARNDKIIAMAHVEELANKYGGPRKLAIIDGTHSSPRNGAARKFVAVYLKKHIKLPNDHRYPNSRTKDAYLDGLPWQVNRGRASGNPFGQ